MIRRAASVAMGVAPDRDAAGKILSLPKNAIVDAPADFIALGGSAVGAGTHDIAIRMIFAGQAHRAVPITGALAAAATVSGGLVQDSLRKGAAFDRLRVATPNGVIAVGADLSADGALLSANVIRTQRRLMDGAVWLRRSAIEGRGGR